MRTIALISGKGGTGKTSLAAALAQLARPVVFADCDVDAANAALLLGGRRVRREAFDAGQRAVIAPRRCTACGLCESACPYAAITDDGEAYRVNPRICEGCGVCSLACEFGAIRIQPNHAGQLEVLQSETGPLVHAELRPAQDNSGKLVARVRQVARDLAEEAGTDLILVDGPPGIGCPVHAALTGVDLALLVTEPTPSGEHDLRRALELCAHFDIPARIVINKADIVPDAADCLAQRSLAHDVPVIGRLPFLPEVPLRLAQGQSLLSIAEMHPILAALWSEVQAMLDTIKPENAATESQTGQAAL